MFHVAVWMQVSGLHSKIFINDDIKNQYSSYLLNFLQVPVLIMGFDSVENTRSV
jgi:hypothetical protein